MGRVIAVANQKGGVGKTTTSINLASSLAAAEVNTLLVDCDPQSNSSSGLGFPKDPERLSTYHVIMGACSAEGALQKPELEQLWVIPSHKNLIGANLELVEAERREFRLRDALDPLRSRFQFIVLDCPPALDLLTLNALVAADAVLIPMQPEYFALEGVSELLDTIGRIRQTFNPQLAIEGVVLTMYDERTNLAQQVASELRNYFGDKVCKTSIPRNIRLAEAPSHGKPALLYDVRSRGCESYIRLAKEILDAEVERGVQVEVHSEVQTEVQGEVQIEEQVGEHADLQAPQDEPRIRDVAEPAAPEIPATTDAAASENAHAVQPQDPGEPDRFAPPDAVTTPEPVPDAVVQASAQMPEPVVAEHGD